jgi:4-carboxymuconolactone decarboxylase
MTARDDLRETGATLRRKLGLQDWVGPEMAPGFSRLGDEVVFGKIWSRPGLALEERMLATLSALTSVQRLPQLATYVGAALNIGLEPRTIQEVMIHCGMYCGVPTMENSLIVVADVLAKHDLPIPDADLPEADLPELDQMGQDTMRDLHGERAENGYAAPGPQSAAKLYATAIQYLYGEVWNRPDITRRQRMICSVASFTAIEAESQSRKFFHSALNVGLTKDEIVEVIIQTGPFSGFPRALNALMIVDEVTT